MTAQEIEIAQKIVRELDRSSRNVSAEATARLSAAREQALAHYQQTPAWGMAWAGTSVSHFLERPAAGIRAIAH